MSFAAPLMLLGLAAAAIPVIIHLVGRRRAPRRPFAALDFVLRCNPRLARRLRLRQMLLLAARMALAVAIALMLAKPYLERDSALPAVAGQLQSAVLILDDTLSMRRLVGGKSLIESARRQAHDLAGLLGAQAEVAVITLTETERPLPALTRNVRRVRSAIAGVSAGYQHAAVTPAIVAAAHLLDGASLPQRQIFLLTDGARHGAGSSLPKLPPNQRLHVVDVSGGAPAENSAIVEVVAAPSSAPGPRGMQITARVCNFRAAEAQPRLTLGIEGEVVAQGMAQLGPWSCGKKSFHHSFARGGIHRAVIALEEDALAEDDRRYLLVEIESPIRVLLVNGAPSPVRHRDELFYLEAALAAAGAGGRPIKIATATRDELARHRFAEHDVVVLANVGALPQASASELLRFVQRGGGLLVAVGDQVEPAALNRSLAGLLPQELQGPVSAAPPGSGAPALRVGRVDAQHPVVAPLWAGKGDGGLRSARFHRVFRLRPSAATERKVIIAYDDGSPALIEARRGEGRALLFTSTLDRDWTDLPIRPGFLPLVQQMIHYLGRAAAPVGRKDVLAGSHHAIVIPPGATRMRLTGPGGLERQFGRETLEGKTSFEVMVPVSGFYSVSVAGTEGELRPLERGGFAANIDARESDVRQSELLTRSATSSPTGVGRAKQRLELWHAAGVLILALLLLEALLLRRA